MRKNYAVEGANKSSKASIEQALFALMAKKDYSEIRISEITDKAGVSRNTYYRNFESKDMIVKAYLCDITDVFFKDNEEFHTRQYYIKLFRTLKKYSKQLELIYKAGLVYLIFDVFTMYARLKGQNGMFAEQGETYAAGGFFFIALRWFENGMKETPAQMTDIIINIRKQCIIK